MTKRIKSYPQGLRYRLGYECYQFVILMPLHSFAYAGLLLFSKMAHRIHEYRFFHPDLKLGDLIQLESEEAKHLKTLRIQSQDDILITDAKGKLAVGRVLSPSVKDCRIEIVSVETPAPLRAFTLHIAIAPTKQPERIEFFLEKAIEIGIDQISFLDTQYAERQHLNSERLFKKAIAAVKQSLQVRMPTIHAPVSVAEFAMHALENQKFIAHMQAQKSLAHYVAALENPTQQSYCVLIGAEGGFSEKEVAAALACNFQLLSLGKTRLRTETAALAACMGLHALLG
jgi:16S rRNA (uracil1498-N3)-methyltransferase